MFPVLARRTLSATLAVGCISLVIIAALVYLQSVNTKTSVSLADRVDSTVTVFIKAHDKTTLESLIKKYASSSSIDTAVLPEGTSYEYALLETGSGSMWAIDITNQEPSERVTLTSSGELPLVSPSASLAKTSAIKKYVGKNTSAWIYAQPRMLMIEQRDIAGELMNAVLGTIDNVLIVWKDDKSGLLLLEGTRPRLSSSMMPSVDLSPAPLLHIDISDPNAFIESVQKQSSISATATAEGMAGILAQTLKPFSGGMTMEEMQKTLLNGEGSLYVTTNNNDLAIAFLGTARSAQDILQWIDGLNTASSDVRLRNISFPKNENIRQDVISQNSTASLEQPELSGWQRRIIGSGSSMPLSVALQGNRYGISNNDLFLQKILTSATTQKKGVLQGTVDVQWLKSWLSTINASIESTAKRIDWSAQTSDDGWLVNWEIDKQPPSPASSSLAK